MPPDLFVIACLAAVGGWFIGKRTHERDRARDVAITLYDKFVDCPVEQSITTTIERWRKARGRS